MLSQREKGINDRYTQRLSRPQNSCWSLGNPVSPSCLVTRIVQLWKRLFDALNWGNADHLCSGEWHWCCGKLKRAILTLALSVCVWLKAVRHWSLHPNITHTSAIDINNAYMTLCRKHVSNVLGPFSSQYIKKQRAILNVMLQCQGKALGQSVSEWMFWFIYLLNKIYFSLESMVLELYIQKSQPNKAVLSINRIMIIYKRVLFKCLKKKKKSSTHYL